MSILDEIEKELKEISPWPWKIGGWHICAVCGGPSKRVGPGVADVKITDEDIESDFGDSKAPNVNFIAKSPERIATLVEFVRAAVEMIETPHVVRNYHKDFDMDAAMTRYEAVREKLGLK